MIPIIEALIARNKDRLKLSTIESQSPVLPELINLSEEDQKTKLLMDLRYFIFGHLILLFAQSNQLTYANLFSELSEYFFSPETTSQPSTPGNMGQTERVGYLTDEELLKLALKLGVLIDSRNQQLLDYWTSNSGVRVAYENNNLTFEDFVSNYMSQDSANNIFFEPNAILGRYSIIVNEEYYYNLLTSRNKPIIDEDWQDKIGQARIISVGCSVGGSVIFEMVKAGFQHFVLVDAGEVDTHNTNRWSWSVAPQDLGKPLVYTLAREILKRNPYAAITIINTEINHQKLNELLEKKKVDYGIEAIDALPLKGAIRKVMIAKGLVVFAPTDLGAAGLVEQIDNVEQLFGNLELTQEQVEEEFVKILAIKDPKERMEAVISLAKKIVGEENIPREMIQALDDSINKQQPYFVQPGLAATLAGVLTTWKIMQYVKFGQVTKTSMIDLNRV